MNGLALATEVLDQIRERESRYDDRAYLFVLAAVQYLQRKLPVRRHVTGSELAWACRDLALDEFGLLAPHILGCWGISRTGDFGRIVYVMVDLGLLMTQPGDREEDFADVFQFDDVFGSDFVWHGVSTV